MTRSRFTTSLLELANKCKPILIKIVPIRLLRKTKTAMISRMMDKIDTQGIPAFRPNARPNGVTLIGYIQGEIGLGQSCRLLASELEVAGLPWTVYNYEQVSAMRFTDTTWAHKITNTAPYNINLFHINPPEMILAYLKLNQIWEERYNIAFWLWELENFPPEWNKALNLVNEIWTPSEFAAASIRKVTHKPVRVIPYAITAPTNSACSRASFQLPEDKFLFLSMYDCNSTMERKNPMGVIYAYKKAFPTEDPNVGLVIKMNNPQKSDLNILQAALGDYRNVYIIADVLERTAVNSLIALSDVFVSLHRAEGFGLVMAEAMLLGTPCVATNWSSNTEFMDEETACMVDYQFVEIAEDVGPYKKGSRWADPDIDQAAAHMKHFFSDKSFYTQLAGRAKVHIADKLGSDRAAALVKERIAEITAETR